AALPAADQSLQQGRAFSGSAAAFAARSHVLTESLARGEVFGPGDIAGMVLGQADGPLLERDLDVTNPDAPVAIDGLHASFAAEHERAGIRRVGQEVVDGAIARACPPDPTLTDRAARQLLALVD